MAASSIIAQAPKMRQLLVPPDRSLRDIVAAYTSKIDRMGMLVSISERIRDDARTLIQRRVDELHSYCDENQDGDVELISQGLAYMFWMNSIRQKISPEEAEANVAGYMLVLAEHPSYFILKAIFDYVAGHVPGHDPGYLPTPGEIRQRADFLAADFREELHRLTELLSAPVQEKISPIERAATADAMKRWLDRSDPKAAEFQANAQAIEDRRRAEQRASFAAGHRKQFNAACDAYGVSRNSVASPALIAKYQSGKKKKAKG